MRTRDRIIVSLMVGSMVFSVFATGLLIWASTDSNNVAEEDPIAAVQPLDPPEVFTTEEDVTELDSEDLVEGEGTEIDELTDVLTVHYHGTFADSGEVFDSSFERGVAATFSLSGVIEGWQEGLIGMKEGGTRRLVIPSDLAYGSQGSGSIPADSDLVFVVELLEVEEGPETQ